jgi:SAM-dependent methyltransferase
MNYENETRDAYRTETRAVEYKNYYTKTWNWARFCTWRELYLVAKELGRYHWSSKDRLLDIPCGTGVLGKLLHHFPFQILASDISPEMMALAQHEYPGDRLEGCVLADITNTQFPRASFSCIVVLGFLHRVPAEIKRATLQELAGLSSRVVIVSCSVDTSLQRLKHRILSIFKRGHIPAPCPATLEDVISECEYAGLQVVRSRMVVPFLSSQAILVLEKSSESIG